MKKIGTIILIIIYIVIVLFILFNKHLSNLEKHVNSLFDVNIDSCKIIEESNNHGGFLGDGETLIKLSCSNFKVPDNWKELPLSKELDEVMNMEKCDEEGCFTFYEKYEIPNVEKGYYYFKDRHSESKDETDDSEINKRASYNFSLMIYDNYNKMLYCYELDT